VRGYMNWPLLGLQELAPRLGAYFIRQ
jgi:hypothetical protein